MASLVSLSAVLLAGCGGTAAGSSGSRANSSSKTIVLRMSWWGDQTIDNDMQKVIQLYEKTHPNVKVQTEFTGYSGYTQRLSTEAAGNNLPDVMLQNYGPMMTQFSSKGALANLQPYMQDSQIDVHGINPQLLKQGVMNGQQVGIPIATNALAILYNPSLLKKAGLSDPKPNWTWNDFIQMSEIVHQKLGIYGARTLDRSFAPELYIREHGQHLFNKNQTGLGFSDSLLSDYWDINLELIKSGAAPNMDAIQQIQGTEMEPLAQQKAAFDLRWSNQLVQFSVFNHLNLRLAPPPGPNAEKGLYLKSSAFLSISKNSKHPKQAADLINFFINNLGAAKVLKTEWGVPVSAKIRDQLRPHLSKINTETYDYIDYVSKHSSPIDPDNPTNYAEIFQDLTDIDQVVLYEKETPEQGAKEFRQKAEPLLK
ncbi:ABC transporter substrate-binding protein [Alicyclobacillus herbarius]|uniref:ABC transporter substrate-binding protein n=1 Tax=Alicyclobacillus herbarius TaxID=122960 RepID=UPI00138ACC81|nr:sugar ABC transporter substrate-binding protein [Alicyclobacillus herbarius]